MSCFSHVYLREGPGHAGEITSLSSPAPPPPRNQEGGCWCEGRLGLSALRLLPP